MEKSFIEKTKEAVVEKALSLWLAAIGMLLVLVGKVILDAVLPTLSSLAIQKVLLPLLVLSILSNVFLIVTVWLLSRRTKLRPQFGVLWDSNGEAYCTGCRVPLSNYGMYQGADRQLAWGFQCAKCGRCLVLQNEIGRNMTLEEARKRLSEKK